MSSPPQHSELSSGILLDSSSSSSSPSLSGKVCIVSSFRMEKFYYAVFILDLENSPIVVNDDGFVPSAPTILFDLDYPNSFYTVCVFNSSLYFFECALPPKNGQSVYTYDLSQHLSPSLSSTTTSTLKMDRSDLRPLPKLLSPKANPKAIPTPDGNRILVFTSHIHSDRYEDPDPLDIEFELYNINNPEKKLPSLQAYLKKIDAPIGQLYALSYAFITTTLFAIQLKIGIFAIDIDKPEPVWKKYRDPICRDEFFDVLEGGQLWLMRGGAYDITNGVCDLYDPCKASVFPFPTEFPIRFKIWDRARLCMCTTCDRWGNLNGFLQLQLAIQKRTYRAHMILDVCTFDLEKYRGDHKNANADALLESKLIKSFKFIIDGYECYDFDTFCLSLYRN